LARIFLASRSICVDLPAPSPPSKVMKNPRANRKAFVLLALMS
jgi:hypothetical protein